MSRIRRWLFGGFAVTACWAQSPGDAGKRPATVFIEARAKGYRNVTLELTRGITKSCPSVIQVIQDKAAAEFNLAPESGASTLYSADRSVEHIFAARWTVAGLTKEVCSFIQRLDRSQADNQSGHSEVATESALEPHAANPAPPLACPIEIQRLSPHSMGEPGGSDPWNSYLMVQFRNLSSKVIVAIRFGASFINALAEKRDSVYTYDSDASVKPGSSSRSAWSDGVEAGYASQKVKVIVWVQKLRFADGTFFVDDGKRSCGSHTD